MSLNEVPHLNNYTGDSAVDFVVLSLLVGIGIGPPGEFSCLAVRTSTPVSVTNIVCSAVLLAAEE